MKYRKIIENSVKIDKQNETEGRPTRTHTQTSGREGEKERQRNRE